MLQVRNRQKASTDLEQGPSSQESVSRKGKGSSGLLYVAAFVLVSLALYHFKVSRPTRAVLSDTPSYSSHTELPVSSTAVDTVKNMRPSTGSAQKLIPQDDLERLEQSKVVDTILKEGKLGSAMQYCVDDHRFTFYVQSSSGLPSGHVNSGIEATIGKYIASILRQEEDKEKLMYDVGMNSGFFGLLAAALGFPVFAFDPQPVCHALMKQAITDSDFDKLETFMMGVGDGGKTKTDHIEVHTSECHGGYSWPDVWKDKITVKVPMHTLSSTVGERHISVMKMDTEGNEMSILQSGVDVFERGQVDYLIVETKPHVWSERNVDTAPLETLARLAKRIVFLESGQTVQGAPWKDGNYLFEFVDKHVSLGEGARQC